MEKKKNKIVQKENYCYEIQKKTNIWVINVSGEEKNLVKKQCLKTKNALN